MAEQPYFDVERGEAVVPWRVAFPRWAAYAFAGVFWVLIMWGALLSGWPWLNMAFISFFLLVAGAVGHQSEARTVADSRRAARDRARGDCGSVRRRRRRLCAMGGGGGGGTAGA